MSCKRRVKLINQLIDGWQGNITPARHRLLTRRSQHTAVGDTRRLIELGIRTENESSGRSASYRGRKFRQN